MTDHRTPAAVTVLRLPGPGSPAVAEVIAGARAVDPWAAVGPAELLDEDPQRLAVLADGPAVVGVLAVHPVGADEAALLELDGPLETPELDAEALARLADDVDTPAPLRAYAAAAGRLPPDPRPPAAHPGPGSRANIMCLMFPTLKICRAKKKR